MRGNREGREVTGARAIVWSLEALGVTDVFGIPGGNVMPLYDALMDSDAIRHILTRHEQGAGHAAEGYAAASGRVGVAIATSGPGATNLVTAIADAYRESVLILIITGQVSSELIGTDAFQEADTQQVSAPFLWPAKPNLPGYDPTTTGSKRQISAAVQLICESERPVLYIGGGVIKAGASTELAELVDAKASLPPALRKMAIQTCLPGQRNMEAVTVLP
jgi:acetolactate synthase-1/2/3 large subunit